MELNWTHPNNPLLCSHFKISWLATIMSTVLLIPFSHVRWHFHRLQRLGCENIWEVIILPATGVLEPNALIRGVPLLSGMGLLWACFKPLRGLVIHWQQPTGRTALAYTQWWTQMEQVEPLVSCTSWSWRSKSYILMATTLLYFFLIIKIIIIITPSFCGSLRKLTKN